MLTNLKIEHLAQNINFSSPSLQFNNLSELHRVKTPKTIQNLTLGSILKFNGQKI